MSEQEHQTHFLFVGVRSRTLSFGNDAPSACFVTLTEEETKERWFNREVTEGDLNRFALTLLKDLRFCRPGSVYLMTATPTGIRYTKKSTPEFVIANVPVSWHAQHRATLQHWESKKRIERDATALPSHEALEPFRDAYERLHGPQRAQLIADVVAFITRGRPKKAAAHE